MTPVDRVLPTLVDEATGTQSLVLDEAVAVLVPVGVDPLERPVGSWEESEDLVSRGAEARQLAEQTDEKWRGVDRAVVRRTARTVRTAVDAKAHLVQDPARLFLGLEVDDLPPWWRASARRVPSAIDGSRMRHICEVISESRRTSPCTKELLPR